jgi:hypothetical protein
MDAANPQLKTRSYISANLNDAGGPPLYVTLEGDTMSNTSSISMSQIVSFDRYGMNPGEWRAPKVRNTIAWTVKMESSAETTDEGAMAPGLRSSQLSLGAAWQINRAVALKAVFRTPRHEHESGPLVTTALMLKRWEQPRVTCSILNSWSGQGVKFLGIGLELETGGTDASYSRSLPTSGEVPETKAELPDDL